jgi:hypothetical protein
MRAFLRCLKFKHISFDTVSVMVMNIAIVDLCVIIIAVEI